MNEDFEAIFCPDNLKNMKDFDFVFTKTGGRRWFLVSIRKLCSENGSKDVGNVGNNFLKPVYRFVLNVIRIYFHIPMYIYVYSSPTELVQLI